VRLTGAVGAQSDGNRLRRRARGRKLDPAEILIDHDVGILPFKVKLESDGRRGWAVVFFESHAE
jgi:hypothetical protein